MRETTVNALLEIINSDHFPRDLFKSTFRNVNDCNHMLQRNKGKIMIETSFRKRTSEKYAGALTGQDLQSTAPNRHS